MNRRSPARLWILGVTLVLTGCFGGGDDTPTDSPNPPANTPPTANAGNDQVVAPGAGVNLNGAGSSDANGTITAYAWTQTAGTAVTLAAANTATPSFTAPATPGALTFQLTVTDNGGASHSDTVTVTVNAIPVANAGADQSVSAGAAVSLTGSGSDADGSIASHSWTQTSGPAVTLADANAATASFTAPATAATLVFMLTVTDDRGATHSDSVTVTVTASAPTPTAPAIGRQPNNPRAFEDTSAMFIVDASGSDLTYEWRRSNGTVVKSGPEPFLLIKNLADYDDGNCYYVVVSNTVGTATSEQGCLAVDEIDWTFDPSDDDETDDVGYALGFGEALMTITQWITGPLTGSANGQLGFPQNYGPPEGCYSGNYLGTTIDGSFIQLGNPPLGHHTLSEAWQDCYDNADDTKPRTGAYLVEYDFPDTWGVGTLTLHVSEPFFNGTIHATVTSTGAGGSRAEEFEIVIDEGFSFIDLTAPDSLAEHTINVERRYASDGIAVDEADVYFHTSLRAHDRDGDAGALSIRGAGNYFHLRQHFDQGDSGEPEFSSTGTIMVERGRYGLAMLEPSGTYRGWGVHNLPPEECPADVCADLPE